MKKSVGYFEAFWLFLWGWIRASVTYRVLRGLYDGIANGWKNSRICSWFRREHGFGAWLGGSIFGKIFRLPVTFLEFLRRRFGEAWAAGMEKSRLLGVCRGYLDGFLRLNLRFLGVLLLSSGCGSLLGGVLFSPPLDRAQTVICIGVMLLGGICILLKGNLFDWFKNSVVVKFLLRCVGIQTEYAWYEAESAPPRGGMIAAAAVGVLGGLLGGTSGIVLGDFVVLGLPLSFLLGFAIPFGIAFVFLILAKPKAGLFAVVFFAPLLPTMAMAGLSLLSLFSMVVYGITHKEFRWHYDGISFLLIAFLVLYLVAGICSFTPVKSLSIWAIYVAFICVYFLVVHLADSEKTLNNLLTVFVLSGFLVCLYGIAQYVFGWDTRQAWMDEEMFADIKMRIYSTLENPNVLGEYILLALPVSVGLMWTRKDALQKIVYAGISAVMFGALILTFSRGCWIGLLIAAAVFITFAAGKLWGLGLIALPIIPMVLPESILNRFTSIGDMKDSSTSYRVYIWMGTLAMMKDFWLSGIGMGAETFGQVYPFYSYNGIVAPHAHNMFLQIMVESGIGGLVLFLLIMAFVFKRVMCNYKFGGGKGAPLSTLMVAVMAGICGFLVQGMFDNCFYNYRVLLIFWYVVAFAVALTNVARENVAQGGDKVC